MENDNLDRSLRALLGDSAPPAVHAAAAKPFAELARAATGSAESGEQARRPTAGSSARSPRSALVWLWAGLSCAGIAAGVAIALVLLVSPAPSWAQVAERFRTLRFFTATVFFTEEAGRPPEKIELWVAQDHRLRAHYRGLMFFGSDGRITQVLSAETGEEIPADSVLSSLPRRRDTLSDPYPALALVRGIVRLGESPDFSLDRLLGLFRQQRDGLQPTPNTDAGFADDMQVFDLSGQHTAEWVRLWVLKRSGLPVRLRVWDPVDGGQTEMVFDFATQMPEEAFDANRVQAALRHHQGPANRLYSLLADSGGRPLTPAQLFTAQGGYHLPEIDSVGRTPDGVVWVLSRNVENRRPDGRRVQGWGKLEDDLGQRYTHRLIGWLPADDAMLEYFVPDDLREGFRLPRTYTLVCTDQPTEDEGSDLGPAQSIGAVPIVRWQETRSIPDLLKAEQNRIGNRTNWQLLALDEAIERRDWTGFDQAAAVIPGAPEQDPAALARDVKVAHKLVLNRQRTAASVLCTRLYPLVADGVAQGRPLESNIVRWHVADLYRAGQREAAQRLANRHVAEALHRSRTEGANFVVDLLLELRLAGLREADAPRFFSSEIFGLPAVRSRLDKLQPFADPAAPTPAPPVGRPS